MKLTSVAQAMVIAGAISSPLLSLAADTNSASSQDKSAVVAQSSQPVASKAAAESPATPGVSATQNADLIAHVVNRNQHNVAATPYRLVADNKLNVTAAYRPIVTTQLTDPVNADGTSKGVTNQTFALGAGTAELYLDSQLSEALLAHAVLNYGNNPANAHASKTAGVFVSEATLTWADFQRSPFYLIAGLQNLPFAGNFSNTLGDQMTSSFSNVNQWGVVAGYVSPTGFNADFYEFKAPVQQTQAVDGIPKGPAVGFGANLGYHYVDDKMSYDLIAGYINNLNTVDAVRLNDAHENNEIYHKAVDGVSLRGNLQAGAVGLLAEFVTALHPFDNADLPTKYNKYNPWAFNLEPSYSFAQYGSKLFLVYQQSSGLAQLDNVDNLGGYSVPEFRYGIGYGITINDNLSVKVQYQHDTAYSTSDFASDSEDFTKAAKTDNVVLAQLNFIF